MELTKGSSGVYAGANQSAGQYRWRGGGAEHTHTETHFFFSSQRTKSSSLWTTNQRLQFRLIDQIGSIDTRLVNGYDCSLTVAFNGRHSVLDWLDI